MQRCIHPCVQFTLSSLSVGTVLWLAPAQAQPAAVCPDRTDSRLDVPAGVVCAIQPSLTDRAIDDGSGRGYGYHVVGIPEHPDQLQGVFVYLLGSGGKPFDPDRGVFTPGQSMEEGMAQNHLVISLAHANADPVGSLCNNRSSCYGPVREEIVYGTPVAAEVQVDQANSIVYRLDALIRFLKRYLPADFPFPAAISGKTINWRKLRLGGSSQGGGHAGYLARDQTVERLCFLASPVDSTTQADPPRGSVETVSAHWVGEQSWQTPVEHIRGVVHQGDQYYAGIVANYATLGLQKSTSESNPNHHWVELTAPTDKPHTAPANERDFAYAREWACF
ncbi:BPSS1187 family protein [Gloeobacter violaceus]|uniref:Gll0643 protein n=1 Tax=Gloeobacter violaceus (strain ATCC 29082 / PCC 7421) TaxID=251221 RepID=Q7NMX2_GLOVI|nr:hypothetical protein [Gloeobacter violaceus]BAC88584.1 gll0643 [Gloeobacter violaceus PCC 7421]